MGGPSEEGGGRSASRRSLAVANIDEDDGDPSGDLPIPIVAEDGGQCRVRSTCGDDVRRMINVWLFPRRVPLRVALITRRRVPGERVVGVGNRIIIMYRYIP